MEGEDRRQSAAPRRRWIIPCLALGLALMAALPAVGRSAPAARPLPAASGGGEHAPPADFMSAAERAAIEAMLAANTARLAAEGRLPPARAAEHVALGWPLAGRDGFADAGYHAVTGFVDHEPGYPNQLRDYACGGRTYDTYAGYNHKGTDYYLWPFAWNKMAAGDVEVVAAADGVIVGRSDGHPDQSCNFSSNPWNAVYVRHSDGSTGWYGHLKRNSLTSKGVGDTVLAGEYLGLVGSSGNSTGPHLHFELYEAGQLVDPYAGSCNPLEGGSWWAAQHDYYDSAVNKLTTGVAPVSWGACPQPDVTNEATQFQPGNEITFTAYYRDQLNTRPSTYRIIAPDGSVAAEWNHTIPVASYALSYWWWSYDFPAGTMTGAWRFEVDFNGQTYRHAFTIGEPETPTPAASATPTVTPSPTPTGTLVPATATPSATPSPEPTSTREPSGRKLYIPAVLAGN